mgnify:CR=1 FL=1
MKLDVNKMVKIAVLAALGIVLMLALRFPLIPSAPHLEYDPADIPILIGGFMFGPVAGLVITVIVSFIQAVTVSAQSGWIGFVMHIIASGTLVLVASLIYKKVRTLKGAITSLVAGSLAMILIMIPANLYFAPKFGIPYEVVKAGLTVSVIPFNIIKTVLTSVLTMLIYKPLGRAFKRINL